MSRCDLDPLTLKVHQTSRDQSLNKIWANYW